MHFLNAARKKAVVKYIYKAVEKCIQQKNFAIFLFDFEIFLSIEKIHVTKLRLQNTSKYILQKPKTFKDQRRFNQCFSKKAT